MPNPRKIIVSDGLIKWLKDNPLPYLLTLAKRHHVALKDHEHCEREMRDWQERWRARLKAQ